MTSNINNSSSSIPSNVKVTYPYSTGTTSSTITGSVSSTGHWHMYGDNESVDPQPDHFYKETEALDFDDVMLVPNINHTNIKSRKEVDLTMDQKRVPIVASNMDNIGTFPVAKELSKYGLMTAITKHHTVDDWKKSKKRYGVDPSYLIPTIGLQNFSSELDKLTEILSRYDTIDHVCFDVANGYLRDFREKLYTLRKEINSNITIIAGNVVTNFGARILYENGANVVKVGIGPGAACSTREVTGVGYPQFSSLLDCEKARQQYPDLKIMSDGGCVTSGDMAKAFGIADYVMVGGMLAGHHETGSMFYGNSSEIALKKSNTDNHYRASEGRILNLKENRGHLSDSVQNWLGGLRSACTYCNSASLFELKEAAQYIKTRRQTNNSLIDR